MQEEIKEEEQQSNNKFKPLYEQCVKTAKEFDNVIDDVRANTNNLDFSVRLMTAYIEINLLINVMKHYIKESEEKCQ